MASFLYFLPYPKSDLVANGAIRSGLLAEAGLGELLADVSAVPKDAIITKCRGPDATPGTLLIPVPGHRELPSKLTYDPDAQTWIRRTDKTWLGWDNAAPPRPVDLERKELIPGWTVKDGYDDPWAIPVARSTANRRGNLPFAVHWDADGKPFCGVSARYESLWKDSARLWDMVTAGARPAHGGLAIIGEGFSDEDDAFLLGMVHRALAVNYRVDAPELAAYDRIRPGWLTQVAASLIANAIVDMHAKRAYEEAQKKTATRSEPAGVSSGLGDPAGSPTTP